MFQNEGLRKVIAFIINFLSWFFGGFFILLAVGGLTGSQPVVGLFFLIMGVVLLPPVTKWLRNKFNFQLTKKIKTAVLVICFVLIGVASPKSNQSKVAQPPSPSPVQTAVKSSPSPLPKKKAIEPSPSSSPIQRTVKPSPIPAPENKAVTSPSRSPEKTAAKPSPRPSPVQKAVKPLPTPQAKPTPKLSPSPTPNPKPTLALSTPLRKPVSGSCQCPYDTDKRGKECGGRSAYSRPRGERPKCYIGD